MPDLRPGAGHPTVGRRSAEPADEELLRRMRLEDEAGLEGLYGRYGGLVFTLALRIVGDRELAREVLQDTFQRAWDASQAYDSQRGRISWSLMGIARNRAIDLLRSRVHQARLREQERVTADVCDRAHVDAPDVVGLRRAIVNALQALTPAQREAIELAYYAGLTQAEIARELSEPLGTIKGRTREAMDRLRQLLGPLVRDERGGVTTP